MDSKREIGALVGAVCILFAVFTHYLLTFEAQGVELGVGFRSLNICRGGACATINTHSGLGTFCFVVGLIAVAALVGAMIMERTQDNDTLWRPAGLLALLFVPSVIIWYVDMSMGGASIGIGMFLGVLGAAGAAFVSLASDGEASIATYERVAGRTEDIEAGLAKYYKNPGATGADAGATGGDAAATSAAVATLGESAPRPKASTAAPVPMNPDSVDLPLPMRPQLATHPTVQLRFAAATAQISDAGVVATLADGSKQQLRFGAVKQLVARRLPVELGHGAVLLLDLVSSDAPNHPIRILPTTDVNYGHLPQGSSRDPNENLRGLVRLVLSLQPDLQMDAGSKQFAEAGTGLPFKSVEHFWQYDGRYPE